MEHISTYLEKYKHLAEKRLEVKHDQHPVNEIVINGIECTLCRTKEHADAIHYVGDIDLCEACYEHYY